ncbi:MAG: TlpA family protein disulfide reductase [Flavobacterium sp.]|nr:MAG: TlpA family protein disulfide reductase [Flavobacterium sp.]
MNKMLKVMFLCICSLLFFLGYKAPVYKAIGTPRIKAGTTKITGKISSPNEGHRNNRFVKVYVPHPISGETSQYEADIDEAGRFTLVVDVETDVTLIGVRTSSKPYSTLLIKVKSGDVTNIDIKFNSNLDIEDVQTKPQMDKYETMRSWAVMGEMVGYSDGTTPTPLYDKSPDNFLNYVKARVSKKLEILNKDSLMSKELKELLANDFRVSIYSSYAFDYEGYMKLNYKNTAKDKTIKPTIQKIDRSYYGFLKDFNLNNPQFLIYSSFPDFQKEILQNEIIALPKIGESNIPSWLTKAKAILADLVGFKDGPYYDILAANAYGRQLNEEVSQLTEKQKKNIADYWKEGEIAKVLLRKNQAVVELEKFKSSSAVGDVSAVADDKVIETIIAKHKGKAVLIDLWATWCSPCLDAMTQFRSTKNRFKDKEVSFVYLTNGSSPRKLWEEKIKGIGNEHYYLSSSQWEYVMNKYQFKYIPSYILYNKKGVLINKFSAFPGSEEVKKMIDGLL